MNVPAGVAVAAVALPETVHRRAFRVDLGDIRVFNASGERVPHLISYARSQSAAPLAHASPFPDSWR